MPLICSRSVFVGLAAIVCIAGIASAQTPSPEQLAAINAGRTPPDYPAPYEPAEVDAIRATMDRVLAYLETASPVRIVDATTGAAVNDLAKLPERVRFERAVFSNVSYEWGVTYAGMLHAAEATGDSRYRDYAATRLEAIGRVAAHVKANPPPPVEGGNPFRRFGLMRSVLEPHSLDDAGAMAAGMIKSARAGIHADLLRPWIDNYLSWISEGQFRLADGTLARNRPLPDALWLDDLYMSVPALAQMGALTGERRYFDDACRQILQFAERMFVPTRGLFMHGWIGGMDVHPEFFWGRANGWAVVATTELLSVLPEDHPDRAAVLAIYRAHVRGLANTQSGSGLWHQLLDRDDSYLETSASAMFVYSIARGINRGWLDVLAHGPAVSAGWNAVAQKVNAEGQVEGVCVGTGMGFDPLFYYHRPVSVYAAHGYGPLLLAGAEMIELRRGKGAQAAVSDGAVQFAPSPSRF
jgi:rhamnogalacturonyl hydrolase YesR